MPVSAQTSPDQKASSYLKRTSRLRFAKGLALIVVIALVVLAYWLQKRNSHCAQYRDATQWLAEYALPIESAAFPSDVQSCLSGRHALEPAPVVLPDENGVSLLLALDSDRPDLVVADEGIVWDSVMEHPWFQAHYLPISTGHDLADPQLFAYHPGTEDIGNPYTLEEDTTITKVPTLLGYQLDSPYITSEDALSIVFYWKNGSDDLTLKVPAPGYQFRVQLLSQDEVWSQISQPLILQMQPVAGQLLLTSPAMQVPTGVQTPKTTLSLVVHLLHPNGREIPLHAGDSLVEMHYLPDSQFTPFPASEETNWQLNATSTEPSIALVGADTPTYTFTDDKVKITLIWQALTTITQDYKVFVHIVDSVNGTDHMIAQDDALPAGWRVPTSSWTTGMYVRDVHWLTLPPDCTRGEYQIYVGMYHVSTGERMWVTSPDTESPATDRILLGSLWVR